VMGVGWGVMLTCAGRLREGDGLYDYDDSARSSMHVVLLGELVVTAVTGSNMGKSIFNERGEPQERQHRVTPPYSISTMPKRRA
jgi:hypothetical protein